MQTYVSKKRPKVASELLAVVASGSRLEVNGSIVTNHDDMGTPFCGSGTGVVGQE